jgi:hypothetical protein
VPTRGSLFMISCARSSRDRGGITLAVTTSRWPRRVAATSSTKRAAEVLCTTHDRSWLVRFASVAGSATPITTFAVAGSAAVVAAHQPGAAPGSGAHIATRTFIGQGGSADGVSLMSVCLC